MSISMSTSTNSLPHDDLSADDRRRIDQIVSANFKTAYVKDGVSRRAQHTKHHGCVKATFVVAGDIPHEYRFGVFEKAERFDALIRFSNGKEWDDRKKDAHGMAIKLLDVKGPRLLNDNNLLSERWGHTTQDFILVDHPTFFSRSLQEYLVFNRYFTRIIDAQRHLFDDTLRLLPRLIGGSHSLLYLLTAHFDLLKRAKNFAGATPSSPLQSRYWSTTPYQLGAQAVKYLVIPEPEIVNTKGVMSENGLGETLRTVLAKQEARFTFGIHAQVDAREQPIEDTTVNWHADAKRFVPLATILIPKQNVTTGAGASDNSLAEEIVYSPWHGLVHHRPLGGINVARREVYLAMAEMRR